MARNRPIVASFADSEPIRAVLGRLHAVGVERDDIALLMAEDGDAPRFGLQTGHKLAEGVAAGSAIGAMLGALLSLAIALFDAAALSLTIALLAGLGLGGGIGSIIGAVVGLGAPNYKAKLAAPDGARILLAVWVADDTRAQRVAQILTR